MAFNLFKDIFNLNKYNCMFLWPDWDCEPKCGESLPLVVKYRAVTLTRISPTFTVFVWKKFTSHIWWIICVLLRDLMKCMVIKYKVLFLKRLFWMKSPNTVPLPYEVTFQSIRTMRKENDQNPSMKIPYLQQKVVLENPLHRDHQQVPQSKLAVIGPLGTVLQVQVWP